MDRAAEAAADERMTLVWMAERLARGKELPPLQRLLRPQPERRRQTAAEMLAVFQGYQASGAPMTIRRRA